jgi:phosphoribosylformimino-5-aminoimidazole carboxamide ribotide isomerase
MLIIPSLAIEGRMCARTAIGEEGTQGKYPNDPIAVAKMWRSENAKAIHVRDIDGECFGKIGNVELIREISTALDITVILDGGLESYEDVRMAFNEIGVYRVTIGSSILKDMKTVKEVLLEFGPRRVVIPLIVEDGAVLGDGAELLENIDPVECAVQLKENGVERIQYHDRSAAKRDEGPPYNTMYNLAKESNLSVTVQGMVRNFQDLKQLQSLMPAKIDSLILGEPLYINAFPCQRIWRIAEKSLIDQQKFF